MNATLEYIWHEFAGKLRQFIRSRVSAPATAEHVLQDVTRTRCTHPPSQQNRRDYSSFVSPVWCRPK
jgi:hypothetical protein